MTDERKEHDARGDDAAAREARPDTAREADRTKEREDERGVDRADHDLDAAREREANPPHTTRDGITAPKFGSSVSGGGDIEPAPGS